MNVITILLDTLRRDHLGCYGNDWIRTPNLDRFAQQSVVFDNAYIASYPCMPARRDIWTGRYEFPWRGWGPLETSDVTFPGLMRAADRTTQLITDHYHLWERGSGNYHFDFAGVEFIRGQESDNWQTDPSVEVSYPAAPHKLAGHARKGAFERYTRNTSMRRHERDYFFPQVVERTMDWLDRNHSLTDFCLFLDEFDPHEPFDPPEHYWQMYNPGYQGEQIIWPSYGRTDYMTPEELRQVRALYAGKVTMVDAWFGQLIDHIERLGLLDTTMIVVTTDHGHMLGEHGIIGKPAANTCDSNLYQELAHVPLLISMPGAKRGRRSELVQPVDLFATMLDASGIGVPPEAHGHSLLPMLRDQSIASAWPRQYAWWGRFGEAVSITDGEWVLFKWPDSEANEPLYWHSPAPPLYAKFYSEIGSDEGGRYRVGVARGDQRTALYNLREDYAQQHDRAAEQPDQVRRLCRELVEQFRAVGAPEEQLLRLGLQTAATHP